MSDYLSHRDYSFVAVRHLRRVAISHHYVLFEAITMLMNFLSRPTDSIEWPECDEILSQELSMYIQRSIDPCAGLEILSR